MRFCSVFRPPLQRFHLQPVPKNLILCYIAVKVKTVTKFERLDIAPFLKWAGGKQWLLPILKPLLSGGSTNRKYIEPFLGGGAVFLAARPANACLSDSNQELIDCYRAMRRDVDS